MTSSSDHQILVVSDGGADTVLEQLFSRTAPQGSIAVVRSRKEIEFARTPKLIILDLMLSNEPAFDVLRWLRSEPRYKQVPVFVLGSKAVDHKIDEAYALGANSCLLRDSETNGLDKIVGAIAIYAGLIQTPECPSYA